MLLRLPHESEPLMYQRDPNHDAAVQIALAMNERLGRKLDASDRLDRGYYRMQRALGTVAPNAKPCGEPQKEEI